MNSFDKIIFVSNEDKTRAPMATTIMGALIKDKGFILESRGMVVLFPEPYNPKAIAAAKARGMNLPSTFSRQLTGDEFGLRTLVLTMDSAQKDKIYKNFPEARNVFTLSEFAGESDVEIPNPYGKEEDAYMECFDVLYGLVFKAADGILGIQDTVREKKNTGGNNDSNSL